MFHKLSSLNQSEVLQVEVDADPALRSAHEPLPYLRQSEVLQGEIDDTDQAHGNTREHRKREDQVPEPKVSVMVKLTCMYF